MKRLFATAIAAAVAFCLTACSVGNETAPSSSWSLSQTETVSAGNFSGSAMVAAGCDHSVRLLDSGEVLTSGDESRDYIHAGDWLFMTKIQAGRDTTFALSATGLINAIGVSEDISIEAIKFGAIDDFDACDSGIIALYSNGTVKTAGDGSNGRFDFGNTSDAVGAAVADDHAALLLNDGTVMAKGDNSLGQCNTADWGNIIQIDARNGFTVGLRDDGTVVAAGDNSLGQCSISGWTDIVQISAGEGFVIGLRNDGTAVATGDNTYGQCNVDGWSNIKFVSAGYRHSLCLTASGECGFCGDEGAFDFSTLNPQ